MTFVSIHVCYLGRTPFDNLRVWKHNSGIYLLPLHHTAWAGIPNFWILALVSGEGRLDVTHTLSARLTSSSGGQGMAQRLLGDTSLLTAVTPVDVGTARDLTCNFLVNEHFVWLSACMTLVSAYVEHARSVIFSSIHMIPGILNSGRLDLDFL